MYEFLDRRYALALYDTCIESDNVELVLEDLKEIVDEMENNEGLMKLIRNPQINKQNKKRIFKELFQGNIQVELLNFLLLLIEKGRILYLKEKYNQFRLIYLEHNNTVIAKIKSVVPLDENQRTVIKEKLEKQYEKTIILEEEIDESLIGGILLRVGNEVIDGSIKNKLVELRDISEGNVVNRYNFKELNKELIAIVTVDKLLAEEERARLRDWLEDFYDRNVVIKQVIAAEAKDNITITIGDDVMKKSVIDKLISGYMKIVEPKSKADQIVTLKENGKVLEAKITTVIPLTEEEKGKMLKALEKFYSRKIVIKEELDETIIGGVLVQIGNDITDGTVRSKLRYIRSDMQ
ncbi:MAG: F0F1 ATP synthase subunit delta [Clostridium sp.]|uniref:F0F1 ATP synthase subunit delta n=1 Tax=Clostridium sp. TaxID=1506 RepID=UPI00304BFB7C